jgi:mRNA-degrading endonuclease toxin of MazEF toxin-antitoxin module
MITCGNTFLLEDEDGYDCHLCIVITPPNYGEVVIVSVTTQRAKSEMLVRLNKEDHPFLEHDSVISYAYSRVTSVDEIERAVKSGTAIPRTDASPKLVQRAQDGLIESDRTPTWVKQRYKDIMEF